MVVRWLGLFRLGFFWFRFFWFWLFWLWWFWRRCWRGRWRRGRRRSWGRSLSRFSIGDGVLELRAHDQEWREAAASGSLAERRQADG